MEETRTTLVQAFENCAARRAAFQTAVVSARGNIDDLKASMTQKKSESTAAKGIFG